MDLGGNRPWDAIIAVMVLGYGVGWFTGTPGQDHRRNSGS